MSTIHISCAADAAYVPHSAAMLHSVIEQAHDRTVHIHYLHGPRFPETAITLLTKMVVRSGGLISFMCIPDERIMDLAGRGHQTSPTWYRIFLPELLPDVDRILYLDCDVIATDPIADLWRIDLSRHYIAAVTNVFEPYYLDRIAVLGLSGPEAYFNAGVVLLNLDLMRRDDCTRLLMDYAINNRERLMWVDQDTLNVVLGHRRLALHPRWNCMNSVMEFPWSGKVFGDEAVEEARRNPAIRHFEGPSINKPWHYMCEQSNRELYFAHRRQTPWPKVEIEGRTVRNLATRLTRRARRR
jgi:lipopolysaccharide biosynthesis glycosyltransferase